MKDIWEKIIIFNDKFYPDWRDIPEVYYSNALAGEVGELCNLIKHRIGGGTNDVSPDRQDLLEECADVFIYLTLLLGCNNVNLEEFKLSINNKIKKNELRLENQK